MGNVAKGEEAPWEIGGGSRRRASLTITRLDRMRELPRPRPLRVGGEPQAAPGQPV